MPLSLFTPLILIVLFPIKYIFDPDLFKKFIKSKISGSMDMFLRVVGLPLIKTDAIIKFDVPVTLTLGNLNSFPLRPFLAEIFMYPLFILKLAPSFLKPFK